MAERDARVEISQVVTDAAHDLQRAVEQDVQEILEELVIEHTKQVGALTEALEQLHYEVHGRCYGLRTCPAEPCAGAWKHLPTARDGSA